NPQQRLAGRRALDVLRPLRLPLLLRLRRPRVEHEHSADDRRDAKEPWRGCPPARRNVSRRRAITGIALTKLHAVSDHDILPRLCFASVPAAHHRPDRSCALKIDAPARVSGYLVTMITPASS